MIVKTRCYLILPLIGIIYFLLEGAAPMRAAMSGLGLCVLVGMIRKETRLNPKKLLDTLESGARSALGVAVACATAGAGLMLIDPTTLTDAVGITLMSVITILQYRKARQARAAAGEDPVAAAH
jgi:TRAP-type uncharacterized transport system fused permease subunit